MKCRIITFSGIEHKSGVTMVAQSVAETAAELNPGMKVLFVSWGVQPGGGYLPEDGCSLALLKNHIEHRTADREEILNMARVRDNYWAIGGFYDKRQVRDYYPDTVAYMVNLMGEVMDLIVCDAGSEIDTGLALGAMENASVNVRVISQNESCFASYEQEAYLNNILNLNFDMYIINKYHRRDICNIPYICRRLGLKCENVMKASYSGFGRQAEYDRQTLIHYGDDDYRTDIDDLSAALLNMVGLESAGRRRRFKWVSSL